MRAAWAFLLIVITIGVGCFVRIGRVPQNRLDSNPPSGPGAVSSAPKDSPRKSREAPQTATPSQSRLPTINSQMAADGTPPADVNLPVTAIPNGVALGPAARLWVAWRILDCVAAVDSPPCSVRISGEAMPVRFRALWNSPIGVPPDPDFLVEIQFQWRKRALRIVTVHADQLCQKLSALRLKMLHGESGQGARECMVRCAESEIALQESWDTYLRSLQPVAPNAGTKRFDFMPVNILIACATLRIANKHVTLLPENEQKVREFDDAAAATWTKSIEQTIDDLEALSKATEQMTLNQLGEKMKGPLAEAFQGRRAIDREIAARRVLKLQCQFAGDSTEESLIAQPPQIETDFPNVIEAERKMYEVGILRMPHDKVHLPIRTPVGGDLLILRDLESLIVSSQEVEKRF